MSALNESTVDLMRRIGAWDHITSVRYKTVNQMQVWDACSDAHITFRHDNPDQAVAHIVENDVVLEAVYKQLENLPEVEVKNQSRLVTCNLPKSEDETPSVELKSGENLTCELLVGADGYNSTVRQAMGSTNFTLSYNQMGVVATVALEEAGTNSIAWQRFLPTGPVALLPLNETLSSLVWSTTPEQAKELVKMEPQQFIDALNDAYYKQYKQDDLVKTALQGVEAVLGKAIGGGAQYPPRVIDVVDKSRAAFPLGFGHVPQYVAKGTAIIGDAAHRIHPLAGQGVNLGFGDVKCLTDLLGEAAYRGSGLGDISHLLRYERERLRQNLPIMVGVHGLQRIYGTDFAPIVALRSVGLKITNAIPPLKKIFMQQAMG